MSVRKDRGQLDIAVELAVCNRGRRRIARADGSCLDRTIGDAQHPHYGGREAYCRGRLRCLPIGHRIFLFARTAPGEVVSRVDQLLNQRSYIGIGEVDGLGWV